MSDEDRKLGQEWAQMHIGGLVELGIIRAAPVEHIESIIIAECDCCGAERALTRCWLGSMETFACDECRGASDND